MASENTATFDASLAYSPSSIDKASTALLLLDYHNFIVAQMGEDGQRTVKVASAMRDWARSNNIPVIHGLIDMENMSSAQPQMKLVARREQIQQALSQSPTLGHEADGLSNKAAADADEVTFLRQLGVVSALSSPGLLEDLKQKGIRSLILCGLSTSGCVFSTARAATDHGFVVTVVEDACADPTPGFHDALVNSALHMTAHVAPSEQVLEELK